MNSALLTDTLVYALADLDPATRQTILDRFLRELRNRDERIAKIDRAAKMKAAGVPAREIVRVCQMSFRDVAKIATTRGSANE